MKRGFILLLTLALLLAGGISCGGGEPSAPVPAEKVSVKIKDIADDRGVLDEDVALATEDGDYGVRVDAGTAALDAGGDPLEKLTLEPPDDVPEAPEGAAYMAVADFGPDGAEFDKPVEITLSYDPASLPAGAAPDDLVIAYYDEAAGRWVELDDITVDAASHTVTGSITHFTLIAILATGGGEEPPSENAPMRQIFDLPALNNRFQDILGQEVWVVGYFGDAGFAHDGASFLVEEYSMLLSDREIPRQSVARLDGNLPGSGENGAALLVHGVIKDFKQVYPDAYEPVPVPLITVADYEVLDVPEGAEELVDYLAWSPGGRRGVSSGVVKLVSFIGGLVPDGFDLGPYDAAAGAGGTPPSECDRVLIISGGISNRSNAPRYANNVRAMYEKMTSLGFTDAQIDVVYYQGKPSGINVGGRDIVDVSATKENIQAIIDRYRREMNPSCTLALFVTDHGTGYDNGAWSGERPTSGGSSEDGGSNKTYAESTFTLDGNTWLWARAIFTDERGRSWTFYKHRFTGQTSLLLREGGRWVNKGNDADGDGLVEEHELGTDINGNGNDTDNYGFPVATLEGMLSHADGEWDTDRDARQTPDMRFHWEGGKLVFQRFENGTWHTIGEDTNGDGKIDGADGGIDWNNDGNKNGRVGFHEGINLLGRNVLWDDEFAEMLRPLSEMGIHINCVMVQCFSGGFVDNLTGIVEFIGTGSSEDTVHWSTNVGGQDVAADGVAFLNNLTGLNPENFAAAWAEGVKADQQAWQRDTAGWSEARAAASRNYQQTGGTPKVESETTYKRHENGMYSIALRLPGDLADRVHDFEIILGLQKNRWSVSLGGGIGFPEGLPEGFDTEIIPGGVRVFSESPIGPSPLCFRMNAPEGTEISRIELTDADHRKVGYTTPATEDIPETNPMEANLTVELAESRDSSTCDCGATLTIQALARDPFGECTISLAEIYIDGQLANRTRFWKDAVDEANLATADWRHTYTRGVSEGRHVVTLKVRNEYGQEIIRSVEVFCCQEQLTMIPASEATSRIGLSAEARTTVTGYAPDCTAVLNITWSAISRSNVFTLKAAWLRVDGAVVAASAPQPQRVVEEESGITPESFSLAFFGMQLFSDPDAPQPEPELAETNRNLGGTYSCSVEPGSTHLIEVIALGSDCRYYIAAWEKVVPSCPVDPASFTSSWCFGGDTLVLMADGSARLITDIETGDMVQACDAASGQIVAMEVTDTLSGQADYYYLINGGLRVTPPHPFYTADRGWVPVEDLQPGDLVMGVGGYTEIASIELIREAQAIYNIIVDGLGNFFVSADGDAFYLVQQQ